jgi:hypothetical protein
VKDLICDKDGKICAAKVAFWLTLFSCLGKIFIQDAPDYSGLAMFLSPVAALYFGRSHTKAKK